MHRGLAAVLLVAQCSYAAAVVTIELSDLMKLPSAYAGNTVAGEKTYAGLAGNVGEKNAIMDTFVFIIGETQLLQVVDTKEHATFKSTVVDMANVGAPGTDVATCTTGSSGERLLAAATQGTGGKQDSGRVLIYTVASDGKLTAKRTLSLGECRLPDQIKWTKDCRTIIAACEGEAVPISSTTPRSLDNPEGGVGVIKFRASGNIADDDAPTITFTSFASAGYNEPAKRDPLVAAGVRWSLRPETKGVWDRNTGGVCEIYENMTTFSRDLEPEYLALSSDGKTVYVSLQENCAIAIFDLATNEIKAIKPLAAKSWASTNAGLDASNSDGANTMQKWNIHGMLMVDTIDIYKASDGKEYLVTANEGDDKEYLWDEGGTNKCTWTEMKRVKSMTASPTVVAPSAGLAQADLQENTKLGRIKAGLFDQRASPTSGDYNKIYTMGGRSFSIINPETMAIVYDSGSLMEEILNNSYPEIFNSHSDATQPQTALRDDRSDDKGLEVESLTLVNRCGKTFLFVGAERTSTIFIFDITDPKNVKLESHISVAGNTSQAPTTSYNINPEPRPNVALGILDPEMMSFDSSRNLLVVTGAFSGSLGVYQVKGLPTCVSNSATAAASEAVVVAPTDTKYFVTITVTMPYSKAEFDTAKQDKYKTAVASAAGTIAANIEIEAITEKRRRAGSVNVQTKIRANDAAGADTLASTLGNGDALKTKINAELTKQGLQESTGVTNPSKSTSSLLTSSAPVASSPAWALALAAHVFAFGLARG